MMLQFDVVFLWSNITCHLGVRISDKHDVCCIDYWCR